MSNKRISELGLLSTVADEDTFVVVDESEPNIDLKTKKVSVQSIREHVSDTIRQQIHEDIHDEIASIISLDSPAFTGTPTAPTPIASSSNTQLATTQFVKTAIMGLGGGEETPDATTSVKGKVRLAGDLGGTADSPTVPGLASKAPLDSPAFTGVVTAPTQNTNDNSTRIATTSWVNNVLGSWFLEPTANLINATVNWSAKKNVYYRTITGNVTVSHQNPLDGKTITIIIDNTSASASTITLTVPAGFTLYKVSGAITVEPSSLSALTFICTSTKVILAEVKSLVPA